MPVKLELKTQWAIKAINFDLASAGEQRMLDLHELKELWMDAYDCTSTYNAKTKEWHDQRLLKKEFAKGDKVLLFNSHLKLFPGKLKSKWTGPFVVKQVHPLGVVELWNKEHTSLFKVNGYRLKVYYDGPINRAMSVIHLLAPP